MFCPNSEPTILSALPCVVRDTGEIPEPIHLTKEAWSRLGEDGTP